MKDFRYLTKVTTLRLQEELCSGCGRCLEVCPQQVFLLAARKAVIVDIDACMECGACAKNCPVQALAVASGVGCASGLINLWRREHGLLPPGSDCCS
jgi:NAD-dependent dihydropyrimidine dehydrogenase PreA subunit